MPPPNSNSNSSQARAKSASKLPKKNKAVPLTNAEKNNRNAARAQNALARLKNLNFNVNLSPFVRALADDDKNFAKASDILRSQNRDPKNLLPISLGIYMTKNKHDQDMLAKAYHLAPFDCNLDSLKAVGIKVSTFEKKLVSCYKTKKGCDPEVIASLKQKIVAAKRTLRARGAFCALSRLVNKSTYAPPTNDARLKAFRNHEPPISRALSAFKSANNALNDVLNSGGASVRGKYAPVMRALQAFDNPYTGQNIINKKPHWTEQNRYKKWLDLTSVPLEQLKKRSVMYVPAPTTNTDNELLQKKVASNNRRLPPGTWHPVNSKNQKKTNS